MSFIKKPNIVLPNSPRNELGLTVRDYEGGMSTLCAGCGHDSVTGAIVQAAFELSIPPHKDVHFEISYNPLLADESVEKLGFSCPELGDFPYELKLKALPAGLEQSLHFKTPLGSSQTQTSKPESGCVPSRRASAAGSLRRFGKRFGKSEQPLCHARTCGRGGSSILFGVLFFFSALWGGGEAPRARTARRWTGGGGACARARPAWRGGRTQRAYRAQGLAANHDVRAGG